MDGRSARRVVLSVPWSSPWREVPDVLAEHRVELIVRAKDWQPTRWQRVRIVARNARHLMRESKGANAVVVCTSTLDAIAAAIVLRLRPRTTLAVWDLLLPSSPKLRRLAKRVMGRVDCWMVIRRGDTELFSRYLGAPSCDFVPFPAFADASADDIGDDGYVYSAGTAHRDWPTLLRALEGVEVPVRISTVDPIEVPIALRERVTVLELQSPQDGRKHLSRAAAVCIPFRETELPSGPVVICDAMAFGKPAIVTDVNGSRDYVVDGQTGRTVAPNDADAMAEAIRTTLADVESRRRMGEAARTFARTELTPTVVLEQILRGAAEHAR